MNLGLVLLDLLYPPRCAFCRGLLEEPRALMCPDCQGKLPWLEGTAAEQKLEFISLCVSPLRYRDQVRESIQRYKFSGMRWYSRTYGVLAAQCARDHLDGRYDLITWVPVSRRRKRERDYDQAYLLARETAAQLGCRPVSLLEKFRDNPPQSGIEEDARRRANVLGVYRAVHPEALAGKRVLLIDDVVTTGETMSECARILRTAGAADVVGLTLARAR